MLKSKATKKSILEGAKICNEYGYWSNEVRNYLDQFEYIAATKINIALSSVYNSCQYKASQYYNLFKENGYIKEI